jgi:hypothetical protein
LSLPFWTDAEVDELSGRLRRTVIVGLKKKKYVENKLKNIQQRIFELQGY